MNTDQTIPSEVDLLWGDNTTSHPGQPSANAGTRFAHYEARVVPLRDRLKSKLAEIPSDLQSDGLHMDAIWPLCVGRQRTKPPAHEVGAALRALGWVRLRLYSDGTAPSGTYWFPPATDLNAAKAAMRARKAG